MLGVSPVHGVTLTWTGLGDGSSFTELANWSGSPTGGSIDPANLVDNYVINSPVDVLSTSNTLAFRAGGALQQNAGTLNLLNGNGFGVLESPNSFGSMILAGSEVTSQYLAEMNVSLGASATLNLLGSGNPVNISTIDFTDVTAQLHLRGESPTDVLNEHIGKLTVFGEVAVEGVNLSVVSDGASGTIVSPIQITEPAVELLVDRDTGSMTLANHTGGTVSFFQYDVFSSAGGLNATDWTSIAGNYDAPTNGGDGSVDADDAWLRFSTPDSRTDLGEGTLGTTALPHNASIELGSAWTPSPFEDLTATLSLVDGTDLAVDVIYSGTRIDAPIELGDLNADGAISATDWPLMRDNLFKSVAGSLAVDAHAAGDLDGSGKVDEFDLLLFEDLYDAQLGAGAFSVMLTEVPEPPTSLGLLALLLGAIRHIRSLNAPKRSAISPTSA